MFGLFRNHVADLKEQARMAEEDERLAQVKNSSMLSTQARTRGGCCTENCGPFGFLAMALDRNMDYVRVRRGHQG